MIFDELNCVECEETKVDVQEKGMQYEHQEGDNQWIVKTTD